MLSWLQIKNFAISDCIELEIDNGLSVITGETGSGKSIIIRALSLVLGQRSDTNLIKHGCQRAEIQVNFDIRELGSLQTLLRELDLDEQNECQLRRVINRESGSYGYINGRRVTANILRQVGAFLVDIHGQNEHQSLLNHESQRELLDKHAGVSNQVNDLRTCFQGLQNQFSALKTLRSEMALAHEKLAFLQFQVDELERFSPLENEWSQLHQQHQRIHHQAELISCVQVAQDALSGDRNGERSAYQQLNTALKALEKAQSIDPELSTISNVLLEAQTLLNESEENLRVTTEAFNFDQSELDKIELRYSAYMDFARKHQVEPSKVFDIYESLREQLARAQNPDQSEQTLLEAIKNLSEQYTELASDISIQRKKSAAVLAEHISSSLQSLAMEGGGFYISLPPTKQTTGLADANVSIGSEFGLERVVFEVSTNVGMPKMPLTKVASGGELSRISLAIALILSDISKVQTLVFDEVDVGVGGKTAAVIGRMLAELSQSKQIICITHLPQVAAFGSQHFRVNKKQGQQVNLAVDGLGEDEKVMEIARMVGGEKLTDESLAHARTLIMESNTIHH